MIKDQRSKSKIADSRSLIVDLNYKIWTQKNAFMQL